MQVEIVTHLGGNGYTTACGDVMPQDSFTASKESVTCKACTTAYRKSAAGNRRYYVDYDAEKRSWGVYSRYAGGFVAHSTTRSGAQIQCRKQYRYTF